MTDQHSVQEGHGSYSTSREVQEYDPWVGSQYTYAQCQSAQAATDTQSINDANHQGEMAAHCAHLNQSLAHSDTQDDQSMFSATSFNNTTPLDSLASDSLWQAMNQGFGAHVGGSGEAASGPPADIPGAESDIWIWNNNNGHGGIHAADPNGYFQEAFSSLPVENQDLYSTGFVPTLAGSSSFPQVPLGTSNDLPLAGWQGPGNQSHATIEQEWRWYGDNPVGARKIALQVVEDAAPLYPDPGASASALLREVDAEHPELRLGLPIRPMYNEPGLPYIPAYPPQFPNDVEQPMEYDPAGERQQDEVQTPHPPSNDVEQGAPNSDLSAVASTGVASSRVSVRCGLLLPDRSICDQRFEASCLQYANRNLRRHQTSRIHNGTGYPCPHAACRSQDPYTRPGYLQRHLEKHCPYDACHNRGPFRKGQLQRHLDEHLAGPSTQ